MTDFETKEYLDYVTNGISGKLTRGLVVDTADPLYSGRVKVWIPTLHGGMIDPASISGDTDVESETSLSDEKTGTDTLGSLSTLAKACLPWAPIMGTNWGPTGNFSSDVAKSVFGIFNVPKIGTEVFIIFEDDNPNLPVIFGAAFHESELIHNSRIKSLEITPGTLLKLELSDEDERTSYPNRVSESFIISSEKGAQLVLTDLDGQEQIMLGSYLKFARSASITDNGSPYIQFTSEYPNFPTTQSAPFRKRRSINTDNPVLDRQVLQASSGSVLARTSETPQTSTPVTVTGAPNQPSGIVVKKRPPVDAAWPKIVKGSYKDFRHDRSKNGKRRIHLGIDLSLKLANLIAPIDCIPLAYVNSATAGKMLLVKGIDGYIHAFLHLDSVIPEIIQDVNSGIYKKYTVGTKLGVTGNTGSVEGAGGGWHLHWEVFHGGDLVKTKQEAIQLRETLRHVGRQVIIKGVPIKGENFTHPYNLVHPLEDWLASDSLQDANGAPITTEVTMQAAQLAAYSQVYSENTSSDYDRVIGLEVSLVPGGEHIFLRHPSGGYAGFDADGNWKVYTPGNAEYKVNRNLVFDVLGGVLTNCLAVYTRAKTVINLMSNVRPKLMNSIGNVLDTKSLLPSIFKRIETSREKDMQDALKQSASNIYYTLEASMLGKSLSDIAQDGYATVFNPTEQADRNYSISTFDALLKTSHSKYVPSSHVLYSKITPALLKSLMLKESNGDPKASNKYHIGLFQLGVGAIKDVTKQNNVTLEQYGEPSINIDIGVQYLMMCVNIMVSKAKKANLQITTEEDKQNVLMAALMGYNFGPYGIGDLFANVTSQANTLSYAQLEKKFIESNLYTRDRENKGKETLEYAPHILYMLKSGKVVITN